jgi:hypothetical protein
MYIPKELSKNILMNNFTSYLRDYHFFTFTFIKWPSLLCANGISLITILCIILVIYSLVTCLLPIFYFIVGLFVFKNSPHINEYRIGGQIFKNIV